MKRLLVIFLFCIVAGTAPAAETALVSVFPDSPSGAQKPAASKRIARKNAKEGKMQYSNRDVSHYDFVTEKGDTITIVYVNRIFCFSKPMDMSKHWKLVRDFRKVYPLAQVAKEKMAVYEVEILKQPTRKAQRELSKSIEKQLVSEYTPEMKRMTVNQGKILVRLIDRETDKTSYEIVKEFRGGFVAGFWQGIAKIFGHNLKDEYDAVDRDRMIEQCIIMYNAGLLPEY